MTGSFKVIVAGYLCVDIIPQLFPAANGSSFAYAPGALMQIGPTKFHLGGAVANTGLALHKLGMAPALIGRIGNDAYGHIIRQEFEAHAAGLSQALVEAKGDTTAYTFVLDPPGGDRMFLVHAGANDHFGSADIADTAFTGHRLLHFGYPPLIKKSQENNGADTRTLFARAKEKGLAVSLDLSLPDPNSEAGRLDWDAWLRNVLPMVDVFLPSLDEIRFMLHRNGTNGTRGVVDTQELSELADELLLRGVAVVVIKLGSTGLYVKTSNDPERLDRMGCGQLAAPQNWLGRELIAPCFCVQSKGATGAGDCAIAGFLTGLLRGRSAEEAALLASAVGACNVEAPDAFSGLLSYDEVLRRIAGGWKMKELALSGSAWQKNATGVYSKGMR